MKDEQMDLILLPSFSAIHWAVNLLTQWQSPELFSHNNSRVWLLERKQADLQQGGRDVCMHLAYLALI